ncbi:MAG TPA: hypothetical protein VN455_14195 [Methanotrichaceae archaeon]|nr:hypothetical protein [Methanotrichaceae archaeon]
MIFDKARNRPLLIAVCLVLALVASAAGSDSSNSIEQSIAQTGSGYGSISLGQSAESYAQVKGQSNAVSQDNTQEAIDLLADSSVQQSIVNWATADNGDMGIGNEMTIESVQTAKEISSQSGNTMRQEMMSYGDIQGDDNEVHQKGYQEVCRILGFSVGIVGANTAKIEGSSNVIDEANTLQAKAEAGYDLPMYFTQKNSVEIRGDSSDVKYGNVIQNPLIGSIQQNIALIGTIDTEDEE